MPEKGIMTLLITSELNWFHNPVEIPVCSMRIVALMLPSTVKMKNCKTKIHLTDFQLLQNLFQFGNLGQDHTNMQNSLKWMRQDTLSASGYICYVFCVFLWLWSCNLLSCFRPDVL